MKNSRDLIEQHEKVVQQSLCVLKSVLEYNEEKEKQAEYNLTKSKRMYSARRTKVRAFFNAIVSFIFKLKGYTVDFLYTRYVVKRETLELQYTQHVCNNIDLSKYLLKQDVHDARYS